MLHWGISEKKSRSIIGVFDLGVLGWSYSPLCLTFEWDLKDRNMLLQQHNLFHINQT